MQTDIADFLERGPYAVVGASSNRTKYGNRVLRKLMERGRDPYPIHPAEDEVEGLRVHRKLADLPETPRCVSIITPPAVTERVVEEAADAGAEIVWMQPGAESELAIQTARDRGLRVIAGGPCVLIEIER